MFNLDQSVSAWRSEMAAGGACASADLDELESHLRDSVARLSAAGLSTEESFLISIRRLGRPDDLRPEYGKAHPERVWRDRATWMLTGVAAWLMLSHLSNLLYGLSLLGAAFLNVRGPALGWAAVAGQILSLAVAAGLAWMLYRRARTGQLPLRPAHALVAVAVVSAVGVVGEQFAFMGFTRIGTPDDFGQAMRTVGYLSVALTLLLPLAFGLLAARSRPCRDAESC